MHLFPLLAVFVGGEIVDLVAQSGAVAKMVLLVLLVFSVLSWALILSKWGKLKRARIQSGRFIRAFRKAQRMQDVAAVAEQFRPSPLVGVFAYTLITHSIRDFAARTDDFALEVLNAVERQQPQAARVPEEVRR